MTTNIEGMGVKACDELGHDVGWAEMAEQGPTRSSASSCAGNTWRMHVAAWQRTVAGAACPGTHHLIYNHRPKRTQTPVTRMHGHKPLHAGQVEP